MPLRPRVFLALALACTAPALCAGPTDSAIVAAMKLPDASSYSWVTNVQDDARTYDIVGQTDRSDFSLVTMPMVSAVRRRVGRGSANSDNQVEAVFKGSEKCVVQTPAGWQTPAELAALSPAERQALHERVAAKLVAAGADHVIGTVAALPALIERLEMER